MYAGLGLSGYMVTDLDVLVPIYDFSISSQRTATRFAAAGSNGEQILAVHPHLQYITVTGLMDPPFYAEPYLSTASAYYFGVYNFLTNRIREYRFTGLIDRIELHCGKDAGSGIHFYWRAVFAGVAHPLDIAEKVVVPGEYHPADEIPYCQLPACLLPVYLDGGSWPGLSQITVVDSRPVTPHFAAAGTDMGQLAYNGIRRVVANAVIDDGFVNWFEATGSYGVSDYAITLSYNPGSTKTYARLKLLSMENLRVDVSTNQLTRATLVFENSAA